MVTVTFLFRMTHYRSELLVSSGGWGLWSCDLFQIFFFCWSEVLLEPFCTIFLFITHYFSSADKINVEKKLKWLIFLHVVYLGDDGVATHSCRNQLHRLTWVLFTIDHSPLAAKGTYVMEILTAHCFYPECENISVVQSGVCDILNINVSPSTHTYTRSCCILLLQFWRAFCTSETW